jgi:hypothetical protein
MTAIGDDDTRTRAKVKVRNARFPFTNAHVRFLSRYLNLVDSKSGTFFEDFQFILNCLDEGGEGGEIHDPYRFLSEKKRRIFLSIQRAENYREQLKRWNMETIMLQGAQVPLVDMNEGWAAINRIDRICRLVFGRTEPIEIPRTEHRDVRSYQDLGDVFKS